MKLAPLGVFVNVNCGVPDTVKEALAVFPVPPFVEVTLPVVLFFTPVVVPVTSTEMLQEPPAAIEPPLKVSEVSPTAGANVPPQVLLEFGVAATCKPAGRASVKATPVSAVPAFGFVSVKVSVVVPFKATVAAPKDLVIEGGAITVVVSLAVFPVPPLVEVTLPVVLFFTPAVAPVTVTGKLQVPPATIEPPASDITPVAAVVVTVPPH